MTATLIPHAEPFSPEKTARILEDFHRDGYVLVGNVLTPEECAALRKGIDRVFDDPQYAARDHVYGLACVRLFETDRLFRDLLVREPIISLCEAVLGKDCHLMAQNAVRNGRDKALDFWHADDFVEFPLPHDIPRHDPRIHMPLFRMTVQMALTDIDSIDHGPTQFVPGSHYSGRQPNHKTHPSFEGRGPVPILCKAGDIYLHNGQCWHRGAPNRSDRVRYLLQHAMARRFVAQRFYPFLNYRMPDHVLEGADERLLRVLGKHPKGPYG